MARRRTETLLVHAYAGGALARRPDELLAEEPLAIQLDGVLVATTMRTPGHDFELAVGFCHTEGLLAGTKVLGCRYCGETSAADPADVTGGAMDGSAPPFANGGGDPVTALASRSRPARVLDSEFNVVTVETGGRAPRAQPRLGPTTAACGLCGSATLTELADRLAPLTDATLPDLAALGELGARVRRHQQLFARTGTAHVAAALDRRGEVIVAREDIGRHNALDKVVGRLLLDDRLPAGGLTLFVSSRASFEMVQKAWAAGFGVVLAVSGPSALAVHTARRAGMVLAGFVRGETLTVYSPELPPRGAH